MPLTTVTFRTLFEGPRVSWIGHTRTERVVVVVVVVADCCCGFGFGVTATHPLAREFADGVRENEIRA